MTQTVHDFDKSLAKARINDEDTIWETVYKRAFPSFLTSAKIDVDGWAQHGGIDRIVILQDGTTLYVDQKMRDGDWNDFALEYWSDLERKAPGWVEKDLACDYIAYAFKPSKRCYLLPFQQLRSAWKEHKQEWLHTFPTFEVQNERNGHRWVTVCVGVPIGVVMEAIKRALIVTW
jgi:hypothetical protein